LFLCSFGLFIKIPYRVLNVPVLNRAWLSFLISEMDVSSGPAELGNKEAFAPTLTPLCVKKDFAQTFQAKTKCNNITRV
jgi:hypothetical protein